jgi:hypothetical protein
MRRAAALFCALCLCARCSAPPQKEIDRAQGALDTARAAGAEQYAAEAFAEATRALQQAHDAVTQRDYRLALSRALDAGQRAQDSARQAADGQARARSEADLAVDAAADALEQLEVKLKTAAAARVAAPGLTGAHRALSDGQRRVQKARSALADGKYLEARTAVQGTVTAITEQISAIDELARPRPAKRRR